MTRKHFEGLADHLAAALHETCTLGANSEAAVLRAAHHVADYCQTVNPRFDRARFMDRVRRGYISSAAARVL